MGGYIRKDNLNIVKTVISDLGHFGSTHRIKKAEIFRKIEPYLTFLNILQLERQGEDIQSKVEELEQLNQTIRYRDKLKTML